MMRRRTGITLVEIVVSVLLGSIVMLAGSKMLSSGMRSSTKGTAHLANVQAAALLMAQIEQDVQRAMDVSSIPPGSPEPSMKLVILEDHDGAMATSTVIYEKGSDGRGGEWVNRSHTENSPGTSPELHPFCKGLKILECTFTRLDLEGSRIGIQVSLKVATPVTATEEFGMKRFIFCRNHASNSLALGWQGR